jgi:chaperonin GroES
MRNTLRPTEGHVDLMETNMKFRPLHDRVVIKRIEAEARSAGGHDESGKLIPIDLKAGDRVLFGKWSGTEVKIDDAEYLIMKESDVMGVMSGTEARKKAA